MISIVDGLAALTGLRDRDALDFAFIRLLSTFASGLPGAARLVEIISVGEDRRCLVRACLDTSHTEPYRDASWVEWSAMPKLLDFPSRQATFLQAKDTHIQSEGASCTTHFPVVGSQGVWAVLEIGTLQPLSANDLGLISAIVVTYQNLQGLLDYGEKDALTELLNRKTFDGAFFKAASVQKPHTLEDGPDRRAAPPHGDYWLAMLDIDHFKRVNDNFGHLIGDEVLLLMARLMRANFRFHDQLYRFGGEEFVVLMRCEDAEKARLALERLRTTVQAYAFPQVGTITVSIGFSILQSNDTPSGAFGRADKAVYYAKAHGRNQVQSYQDLVASGELVEEVVEEMDVDLF
jgi:diguanylate cyclase (GGDEF)-like protein